MRKKRQRKLNRDEAALPGLPIASRSKMLWLVLFAGLAAVVFMCWHFLNRPNTVVKNPTFTADVAPLIYANCSGCHHAGGSGPFELLTYADVSKRSAQIIKVTQSRFMPPWMPAHGYGDFEGERYLSDAQLKLLYDWVEQGLAEGDAAKLPAPPHFDGGWQLGTPDLVVQLPRAFTLPAEGRDVYRNFVIPLGLSENKYVKGMDFHAGTTRIHHAFMYVDPTAASRKFESVTGEPGWWNGMGSLPASAHLPSGLFASWQPGKTPRMRDDMAWLLEKDTDLLLQVHMQPSGKPEAIQPSIAFYFGDRPGTKKPITFLLRSTDLDIPAGENAYTVRAQCTLSADVDVLTVLPHVHYLGKDLRAFATLPDGSRSWLLWITDWDFNWQGDYAFKAPVFLPKGSVVEMDYTFDNSAGNPRNPNNPPKRVRYGAESNDEMAEFWFQLTPREESARPNLEGDKRALDLADSIALYRGKLRRNPEDGRAHLALGKRLIMARQIGDAEVHFRAAVKFDGGNTETHYFLAYVLSLPQESDRRECLREFLTAIKLDPENYEALNGLGAVLMRLQRLPEAEAAFAGALRIRPNDALIKDNLAKVRTAMGR